MIIFLKIILKLLVVRSRTSIGTYIHMWTHIYFTLFILKNISYIFVKNPGMEML